MNLKEHPTTPWQIALLLFKWTTIVFFSITIFLMFMTKEYHSATQLSLLFCFMSILVIHKLEEKRLFFYNSFHTWYNKLEVSKNTFLLTIIRFFASYPFLSIVSFLMTLLGLFLSLIYLIVINFFDIPSEFTQFFLYGIYILFYTILIFSIATFIATHKRKNTFTLLSFLGTFLSIFLLNTTQLEQFYASVKEFIEVPSLNRRLESQLNIKLPKDITHLREDVVYSDFFMGPAYEKYKYRAYANYFELLEKSNKFPEENRMNTPIKSVSCDDFRTSSFFNTYTKESQCYFGVVYPYYHNIIYNPSTKRVEHLVGHYVW